ncbi:MULTISPECIES: polyhydroxyalkanoate synthesis repressor PhaR [unclassified Novosphingobium]|uniref:polyhydroxyalkanoate synthesis repressor PhaR n=1 Tax=unclassified Novosphingobium TaxID=2644732 RepID=UPI0025E1A9D6|nr:MULTISPECIES: polyhydroxyalkanoate synthesis repressor PhaR [unclassified Novosphingobium]HQV02735.1 polyhydroxyalkanoate synthesis repressor PhaR [Novosphingobium sp.]
MSDAKGETVVIKKYANRRLYNTKSSSYITLDHLAKMTREGVDFKVLDAKSGTDITHQILTQIIMEEESTTGEQMLPVNFLRQLIGMYGNSMQGLVPHYLEASMDQFRANQSKLREAFESSQAGNPLAKLAQQNLAMFKAAASAFVPGLADDGKSVSKSGGQDDEIAALRKQMAEMQAKLDKLGKD